ncbi:MAG TPA: phosphatidate cytidylyltransferase [Blastocatellia bacterium]|nr:phosphatidate cytidylyltransferase [Blastocatellia bacterium]
MSPSAALASDVFRIFALLTTGLLVIGGGTIAVVRFGFEKSVSHAWDSYRGWLVMVPVISVSLFAGRAVTICFLAIVSIVAFTEYARATGLHRDLAMTFVSLAGIAGIAVIALAREPATGEPGQYAMFNVFMAMPVFVSLALVLVSIFRNQPEGQLKAIALALFGFLYVGWMFGHLAFLANSRNAYGYLLYLLFAVELNDVAAFVCGKMFGRRPLCTNVSPWKTREGALGAVVISALFPLAVRFALPEFSAVECVIAGLIVGVGGHLGDLSISVIKRDVGVKDMGTLIRGHGGVLDRIDSLLYAAPLFFHFTRYVHGG